MTMPAPAVAATMTTAIKTASLDPLDNRLRRTSVALLHPSCIRRARGGSASPHRRRSLVEHLPSAVIVTGPDKGPHSVALQDGSDYPGDAIAGDDQSRRDGGAVDHVLPGRREAEHSQ